MSNFITVSGIDIKIDRKDIKNLHLTVLPPDGRVRVAAPNNITDDNVRLAVISKLSWIKKQQAGFQEQVRQSKREMVSGESHYYFGKRYRMEVIQNTCNYKVTLSNSKIYISLRPGAGEGKREELLTEWYRAKLKKRIHKVIKKWEPIIGVQVNDWGIKKMKTKWGSCNISAGRIWINLELAKKPTECLEYIVVHEMVHLLERHHNEQFRAYIDKFLPQWQLYRQRLNRSPLAHEDWIY